MTPRRLIQAGAGLILLFITGCDNFRWGGADIAIVSPPPRAAAPAGEDGDVEAARMPEGPILFHVRRTADGAVMRPIAEIAGPTLTAIEPGADPDAFGTRFVGEYMRQGSEFVLFSNGVRVGSLVIQSAGPRAAESCPALPEATGILELAEGTDDVIEMLALSRLHAPQVPRRIEPPRQPTRSMQVIAPILAERVMRSRRAQLPANWSRAMAQLRPFPYGAAGELGFAATFLVNDTLGPGLNNEGHSTFFVGAPRQVTFDTAFVRFASYPETGKRATRVVDFLDWNRSGSVELLLEVFSVTERWYEAVGRDQAGRWQSIYDGRCAAPAPVPSDPPPDTTD